jgi:hypothetical protein
MPTSLFRTLASLVCRLAQPGPRRFLAWSAVVVAAGLSLQVAWNGFATSSRGDGNSGHATIDFGGQYMLARMMIAGQGHHLYDRKRQWPVLEQAYSRDSQAPNQPESDAEKLMSWTMGSDSPEAGKAFASFLLPLAGPTSSCGPLDTTLLLRASQDAWTPEARDEAVKHQRGGPLYPPTQALLFAPLALLPPQPAYRLVQVVNLALIFWCGWVVHLYSDRRLSWPIATLGLILFPGFSGAINLGQNPVISLTLLMTGWLLMNRRHPFLGGILWGLLAFKPVWAVAFGPALVLTGRWRAAAGMVLTGVVLVALTLPLVGVDAWFDWVALGKEASDGYDTDENWIHLSRDLSNVLRRYTLTFKDQWSTNEGDFLPRYSGKATWLGTTAVWLLLSLFFRRRVGGNEGVGPAFVLLGAWMSCFHFMYYDTLLAALPVSLLFTDPARLLELHYLWLGRLRGLRSWLMVLFNQVPLIVLVLTVIVCQTAPGLDTSWNFPPFDTIFLWFLWLWCGVQVARPLFPHQASLAVQQGGEFGTDVGGAHQGFGDQDGPDARGAEAVQVGPGTNTTLADQANIGR